MKKDHKINEQLLITRLKKGNLQAYEIVFLSYTTRLCNYICKLSNDKELSKDLVQNVMIRLWEKRSSLQINTSVRSYLFRACHNEFLMHIRKQKREQDMLDILKWETLSQIHVEQKENLTEIKLQKIEKAIEQLPAKCKQVFKLSRLEQKKHKEIAVLLGISTKTIENQITKAVKFLKTNVAIF